MIIAERKPIDEIKSFIEGQKKVLVVGCRGCVTVCNAGGTKEVEILASLLRLDAQKEGHDVTVDEHTLERQCDPEYIDELVEFVDKKYDAILSMACSVGPQFLSRRYPKENIFPALNTNFIGGALAHGIWAEHCQACGNCIIHKFGGMCPVTRCSKSLMNGPCGGSAGGVCEISKEVECIWHLIATKFMEEGKLEQFAPIQPIKDWSSSRDGGPRKIVREELVK
ncbi:MAG: methylenetetrahydrofolate reductase C-terminal domain-containing protein [Deltaproteobacteria bacterium]|jgi:ferredoxin|nr:methylenetetrahydrofolate reductase C-terminal domain-containing protein [Deltaproteobacteria bacterium]